MPSRMERYHNQDELSTSRSGKNQSLYDRIQNIGEYTNIEGVASIESNNEIDISRVKKMISSREDYKRERELKTILNHDEVEAKEEQVYEEEEKNYDINDLLNKAIKETSTGQENYRKLDDKSYKELKNINKNKKYTEEEKEELAELLKTIKISELSNDSDDVGLLDDLKSDTIVGDASTIKKIIEEEKANNSTLERSMYTTNFGLTKKDFEDLKEINDKVSKTNNKILILLMVIIVIIIVAFTIIILL